MKKEYIKLLVMISKKSDNGEYAKKAYNDIDILLQTARGKLCVALGEYEKAANKARESLI